MPTSYFDLLHIILRIGAFSSTMQRGEKVRRKKSQIGLYAHPWLYWVAIKAKKIVLERAALSITNFYRLLNKTVR